MSKPDRLPLLGRRVEEVADGDQVTVNTDLGPIVGTWERVGDKWVRTFLGVPYAKQPLGDLRLRRLQPLEPWTEPLKAFTPGNACLQAKIEMSTQLPMGEDCIYLNIWVPEGASEEQPAPVLFHIHGGAFTMMSGSEPIFDCSWLAAARGIVCVSINYRLGPMGFISLPPEIEENLGLLDQQFALQWTHRHISRFGGDPTNITIYGESAGGASAHWHAVTPDSARLFARAILASGVLNKVWSIVPRPKQAAHVALVLKRLGCDPKASPEQKAQFLRSVSTEQLETLLSAKLGMQHRWAPVEDRDYEKADLLRPILIGNTSKEGHLFPDIILGKAGNGTVRNWSRRAVADAISEHLFDRPMRALCERVARTQPDLPVYAYLFDYDCPTRNHIFLESVFPRHSGCCHACDLFFMFGHVSRHKEHFTEEAAAVCDRFLDLVLSFMRSGEQSREMPYPRYTEQTKTLTRIHQGDNEQVPQCQPPRGSFQMVKAAVGASIHICASRM